MKTYVPSGPEEAAFLAQYDIAKYEQPSVTVDDAIFTIRPNGKFSTLLIKRGEFPYKDHWAIAGGFHEKKDGSTTAAAWRELAEETGVEQFSGHLEQLGVYSDLGRDPRGWIISVAHVAFAPNLPEPVHGSDAVDARWWPVEDLNLFDQANPDAPVLAFDHDQILRDAVERIRSKIEYTTLATEFVGDEFTLPALHQVYLAVWGVDDKVLPLSNFRRKVIKSAGFAIPTGETAEVVGKGGPRPLRYRKGPAKMLQPAMLRPGTNPAGGDDNIDD